MRHILPLLTIALLAGCYQPTIDPPPGNDLTLFNATSMRIHPIFTQLKNWTGAEKPDGVEVLLEFQDQFGDPTKADGTILFELFEYRQANPEPRGQRLSNPWIGSIVTLDEQRSHWNRTSRTYTFQLAYPQADPYKNYVLTAVFRANSGGRFFDRIVLPSQEEPVKNVATQPTSQPIQRALGQ
jgi:hypothetical protein